jgi:hypothetical protein
MRLGGPATRVLDGPARGAQERPTLLLPRHALTKPAGLSRKKRFGESQQASAIDLSRSTTRGAEVDWDVLVWFSS